MAAKTMDMVAIRQRPASCAATSRPRMPWLVVVNRSASAGPEPSVLARVAPPTDRDSSTWPCREASAAWRRAETSRRIVATLRET